VLYYSIERKLGRVKGNVAACKRAPEEVKWQMKQLLTEWKRNQARKTAMKCEIGGTCGSYPLEEKEDVRVQTPHFSSSSVGTSACKDPPSNESAKKRKMQDYLSPRTTPGAQSSTKCALATEEKVRRD